MDKRINTSGKRIWLLFKEEKGEVNMVAIVLIILVVLGLVVIFKDQLTQLLNTLFQKIETEALEI